MVLAFLHFLNAASSETNSCYSKVFQNTCQQNATGEELQALEANQNWDVNPKLESESIIESKVVYSIKVKSDGSPDRYNTHHVALGYKQEDSIYYEKDFAPIVKIIRLKTLLVITIRNWPLHQIYVKNTFLHGVLQETVT